MDICSKYKQLRNRLSNQLERAKLFYLSSLADSGSPNKRFWGCVKSLSGRPAIPDKSLIPCNTMILVLIIRKILPICLVSCFAECFNTNDVDVSEIRAPGMYPQSGKLSNSKCSAEEVYKLISLQDSSSAAGVDGIAGAMLKGTSLSVFTNSCRYFQSFIIISWDPWKSSASALNGHPRLKKNEIDK